MDYASKAVAGTGLGLGIAGTALGVLGGNLSRILNGGTVYTNNGNATHTCNSDDVPVNRYELTQEQLISELKSQIALRDANFYAIGEIGKVKDYFDNRFARVEEEICNQKVLNATTGATVSCLAGQVNTMQAILGSITKTVVPNSAICPGWGDVTVSVTPATAAATTNA